MATKTTDKKKNLTATPTASSAPAGTPSDIEKLASDYLAMRIHQFLVSYGEPARLGDIAQGLVDDSVSVPLVRYTLTQYPSRFLPVDRRWDVRARFLDRQRPASKLLEEIVASYDAPIAVWDAAHELGTVIGRSVEGSRSTTERLMKLSGTYAPLIESGNEVKYGLRSWLLDIRDEYINESDILFYNFLPDDAANVYSDVKGDFENDPVGASLAALAAKPGAAPKVIDNRLLQYIAWKQLQEDFDGAELYNALATSGKLFLLPEHRWTDEAGVSAIRAQIAKMSESVAELPEEEETGAEEATPLALTEADIDEMFRIVAASEVAISAAQLLQDVYDASPGERTYNQDLEIVTQAIRNNANRFMWVGYDRYRKVGSLPPYIGQVPESLQFPVVPQIPDPNEDLYDQLLEDEGFERGLERDIRNPVAMDVIDQDPSDTILWPSGESAESRSIRLVLKAHHKEIGTFPLCQIPQSFIAMEPAIVELTLRDARGGEYQVFADYESQLIYGIGLFDLYSTITADSGAVFMLERTGMPGEFRFINNDETDPEFYISPERLEQLQAYRAEVEDGPAISTHDIARYILEHSNSAMSYLSLLTEVNIVRRTTRRQLASILSGWTSFTHKGGLWSYDSKKSAQGFNKARRKYII